MLLAREKAKAMKKLPKKGDRVRRPEGSMLGTVVRVARGQFSGSSHASVVVLWDSGSEATHADQQVVVVQKGGR